MVVFTILSGAPGYAMIIYPRPWRYGKLLKQYGDNEDILSQ